MLRLHAAAGVAQLEEHAAAADRSELVGVTDEGESPLTMFGMGDEARELGGVQHAGLVDEPLSWPSLEPGAGIEPATS